MNNTVQEVKDRQFRVKMIARGIAFILVGAFVVSLTGTWETAIGSILAGAGVGIIIQGVTLKV